ncbi:215_t:CDS:1, partial [Dentiscutata heterogama]
GKEKFIAVQTLAKNWLAYLEVKYKEINIKENLIISKEKSEQNKKKNTNKPKK